MLAGFVDEPGIFVAAPGIEHERRFLHQHVGEADDGVERRAQLVAHGSEETALAGIGALGLGARFFQRPLLALTFGHITQHGDDFAAVVTAGIADRLFERPAAHLDPHELHGRAAIGGGRFAPHAEFDGLAFAQRRGVAERGQISRPVGHMDAAEQALPVQVGDAATEQRLRGRRYEEHGAVAAVSRNHVGHVARQEPVAVFLGVKEPEADTRQRLGAEREPGRVQRRRYDAERSQCRMSARIGRRQQIELAHKHQQTGGGEREGRGDRNDATGRRQRRFERHNH